MILDFNFCTIHVIDSCKLLPASRHKDFYNYLAQEKDLGSDTSALKKRMGEALTYFESDPKSAKNAIMNAYFTIGSMIEKIDYTGRAFAILISKYSISGKEYTPDYSDDGLDKTIDDLSSIGLTQEMIESKVDEVKKKSKENWPFISLQNTE